MREVLPQVDEVVDSAIPYFSAVSAYREAQHDGKTTEALDHFYEAAVAVGENSALRLAYLGLLNGVRGKQRTYSTQVVKEIEGEILLDDRNKGLITQTRYEKQVDDLEDPKVLQKRAEMFVKVFKAVIPKEELVDVVTKKPSINNAKKELGRQREAEKAKRQADIDAAKASKLEEQKAARVFREKGREAAKTRLAEKREAARAQRIADREVARAQRLAEREATKAETAKRRAEEKAAEEERIKNIPQDTDIHLNIDKSTGLFVSGNNKTPDLDDAERAVLDALISEALEHRSVRVAASIIKRNRIFRQMTAHLSADDPTKLFNRSMKNLRLKLWEEGLGNLIETTGEGYQRAYRINPSLHIHKVTEGQQRTWGQAPVAGESRAPVESAEKKSGKKEIQWTVERATIATNIVRQLRDLGSIRSGLVPVSKLFENTTLDAESITPQEFNRVARLLEKAGIALTNAHTTARQKRQGGTRFSVRLVQDNELVKQLLKDDDAPLLEFIESLISEEPN